MPVGSVRFDTREAERAGAVTRAELIAAEAGGACVENGAFPPR